MKYSLILLSFVALLLSPSRVTAQTIWTDGGNDSTWSNPLNWSAGVPVAGSAVQIGTDPSSGLVGLDVNATVASFAFNNTLTAAVDVVPASSETLQVNGAITNNSAYTHTFALGVIAGASATWTGPLQFSTALSLGTNQITLADTLTFISGATVTFSITNASTYGRFLGVGTAAYTLASINFAGSYAGVDGDVFDFSSGSFAGATINFATLPTLSGGLTWDTTNFVANGTLTVIPEPQIWTMFALGLTAIIAFRRRQKA